MSKEVSNVEPREVWKNFVLLNEVPRPSKKEERVIEFLISFAKQNNLEYKQDEVGNLVIVKEWATSIASVSINIAYFFHRFFSSALIEIG